MPSPSPPRSSRRRHSRSRSPNRPKARGFRWKERPTRREDDDRDRRDGERDDRVGGRGYRNRSPPRRERARSPERREDGDRKPRAGGGDKDTVTEKDKSADKKDSRKQPAAVAAAPAQQFMVVNINDRLGTKAAIPCLENDTVGQFKMMVAARIGRKPHEIMLRRQGERPFKDHITLGDYGVSNGVQLDLELDTGD